jgi:O-acetyl-ADP-ribose deacetylase (regulator of RNase III)
MEKVEGNLIDLALEGKFDVIAHGCNCFGAMGAGIAKSIKEIFPEAYAADSTSKRGDYSKLGGLTHASCETREGRSVIVANLYTQYHWGLASAEDAEPKDTRETRYKAIASALEKLRVLAAGRPTGLPRIGAGLAGGEWEVISKIIEDTFPEAIVVELPQTGETKPENKSPRYL